MKMIGTQDMIDGFWILNDETKIIKEGINEADAEKNSDFTIFLLNI